MILLQQSTSQRKYSLINMLPVSLYIHMPWCIRKCPYCDFNSHQLNQELPEERYIQALLSDLDSDLHRFTVKNLESIFIGGGTPSLLSARAYEQLFEGLQQRLNFKENMEITLEANPGSFEQQRFKDYRNCGINRLSIGIQSLNDRHLKTLGRIHDSHQARSAIDMARKAGFDNINLDIMHSLPQQTIEEGLEDLQQALTLQPEHLSWYQLTLEPNTKFYKQRPPLPSEEFTDDLEQAGFTILKEQGFQRYEISAFAKSGKTAAHNLNYWRFGDYLGIGAGAHGKIAENGQVFRTRKRRQPSEYLNPDKGFCSAVEEVLADDLIFEFMLNLTRLEEQVPLTLFYERTGLSIDQLMPYLQQAHAQGLIILDEHSWQITRQGRRFTNNLQALFLIE